MDEDRQDLANHLFAVAMAMLEDAIEVAATGQSSRLARIQLAETGRRLQAAARDIAVISDAAVIVSNLAGQQDPERSEHTR